MIGLTLPFSCSTPSALSIICNLGIMMFQHPEMSRDMEMCGNPPWTQNSCLCERVRRDRACPLRDIGARKLTRNPAEASNHPHNHRVKY